MYGHLLVQAWWSTKALWVSGFFFFFSFSWFWVLACLGGLHMVIWLSWNISCLRQLWLRRCWCLMSGQVVWSQTCMLLLTPVRWNPMQCCHLVAAGTCHWGSYFAHGSEIFVNLILRYARIPTSMFAWWGLLWKLTYWLLLYTLLITISLDFRSVPNIA